MYTKDKNNVYYNGKLLPGEYPENFKILNKNYAKSRWSVFKPRKNWHFFNWFWQTTRFYYKGREMENMPPDPSNYNCFKVLEGNCPKDKCAYAKDKYHVYFRGRRLVKADPKTFSL